MENRLTINIVLFAPGARLLILAMNAYLAEYTISPGVQRNLTISVGITTLPDGIAGRSVLTTQSKLLMRSKTHDT